MSCSKKQLTHLLTLTKELEKNHKSQMKENDPDVKKKMESAFVMVNLDPKLRAEIELEQRLANATSIVNAKPTDVAAEQGYNLTYLWDSIASMASVGKNYFYQTVGKIKNSM